MERMIFLCLCAVTSYGLAPSRVEVNEDGDAVLPCSTNPKENIESTVFHWKTQNAKEVYFYENGVYSGKGHTGQDRQFVGLVSHFEDELKNGNASIKITKTTVDDSGNYTCILPNLQPIQMYPVQLIVQPIYKDRTGENPSASPKPSIEVLNQTQSWALLLCQVQSTFPKPSLELQDSFGNISHAVKRLQLNRGGTYDMTVEATVNKTDHYHCVLRQEELKHEISMKTFVFICEKECHGVSWAGWFVGGFLCGAGLVVVILLLALRFIHPFRHRVIKVLSTLLPRCDKIPQNSDLGESGID